MCPDLWERVLCDVRECQINGLLGAACAHALSHLQDQQWRGMEWLFHNMHGRSAEAAAALAALVRDGDPSGRAAQLMVPPGMAPATLSARAALLNKATVLLKMKASAPVGGRADAAAAAQQQSSLGSQGGPSEPAATREIDEAEVMLAVLRLRIRVHGTVGPRGDGAGVDGLVRMPSLVQRLSAYTCRW